LDDLKILDHPQVFRIRVAQYLIDFRQVHPENWFGHQNPQDRADKQKSKNKKNKQQDLGRGRHMDKSLPEMI
jgi:hypothetical protein